MTALLILIFKLYGLCNTISLDVQVLNFFFFSPVFKEGNNSKPNFTFIFGKLYSPHLHGTHNISFVTYDDYSNPMRGNNVNIYFKQDGEYKVLEKVVVPNGVTSIDDYRFYGFNMSEVVLPEGLTRVGYYTFGNCKNLNKINLDLLTYIDGVAFANTSIEDVTISNDLEYLGSSAFSGTKIKKIVIVDTLSYFITSCR